MGSSIIAIVWIGVSMFNDILSLRSINLFLCALSQSLWNFSWPLEGLIDTTKQLFTGLNCASRLPGSPSAKTWYSESLSTVPLIVSCWVCYQNFTKDCKIWIKKPSFISKAAPTSTVHLFKVPLQSKAKIQNWDASQNWVDPVPAQSWRLCTWVCYGTCALPVGTCRGKGWEPGCETWSDATSKQFYQSFEGDTQAETGSRLGMFSV